MCPQLSVHQNLADQDSVWNRLQTHALPSGETGAGAQMSADTENRGKRQPLKDASGGLWTWPKGHPMGFRLV